LLAPNIFVENPMQKPFQLSDDMAKELVDGLATAAKDIQASNDAVGDRPSTTGLHRRPIRVQDFTGPAPGPEHDLVVDQSSVDSLLKERGQTHGPFRDNARLSQHMKAVYRSTAAWEYLDDVEKEALDMIALKMSRILSGKSLEKQHWEDIVGYAKLAEKECT
jgi:hypothetical protein